MNQASLGLIPRRSIAAMSTFLTEVAQHGNVNLSDNEETGVLDGLRSAGAKILGADLAEVAVVSGASEGLNHAASILASQLGQVVLVSTDFPAVTSPWLAAQQRLGMSIRWVDDRPDNDLTNELIEAVTESTTVVCFSAVQYASGTTVDVAAVAQRADEVGAIVVVDVTQMAGAVPVTMKDWGVDIMVCSGYKWLSGHGGVALFAVSDLLPVETPPILGWMGTVDPFDFDAQALHLAKDARRFQLSTMAYSSAIGLTQSIGQLQETGIDVIAGHGRALSCELVDEVAPLGWRPFRPLSEASAGHHIVALQHQDHDADHVQKSLANDHNIFVSSRRGQIRVSLHGYNDSSDIEFLAQALALFS